MSSTYKKIQEVNFNQFYIDKCLNGLNKVISYLKDINIQYLLIKKNFKDYEKENITYPLELSNNFNNEINNYLKWLEQIDKTDKEKYIKDFEGYYSDLKNIFMQYYEKISLIYSNPIIKKISEFNENIKNIIFDLPEFDPPNINNISTFINLDSKYYDSVSDKFYEEPDENKAREIYGSEENIFSMNSDENEISLKCFYHPNIKGKYYCFHCQKIFCDYCGKNILNCYLVFDHEL